MNSSIPQRLARLRRRLRATTILHGASLLVAVVGGSVLLAGFVDWLVHVDDAGVRCLIGVVILLAGVGVVVRALVRPLRASESNVRLAMQVERRFPQLRDDFASTVAFLEGADVRGDVDPRLGSPALQRRTIDETEQRMARVDLEAVVRTRPARNAALAAIGVCLVIVLVGLVRPTEAGTALERLVFPFTAAGWPRTTDLDYVDEQLGPFPLDPAHPLRRAAGETLELFVVNALGSLPDEVSLETRVGENGVVTSQRLRRITLRGPDGEPREVFKLSLPIPATPAGIGGGARSGAERLAFRVVGGDDRDGAFQSIEVVPPPALESLRLVLVPPAYTGDPPHALPEGAGHVAALVGTRVDVVATTTKRVRRAELHVRDRVTNVPLAAGGRSLRTSFELTDPGVYSYWFQLLDEEEVENARAMRYEIRATSDLVPMVTIEEPPVDGRVTPRARLPLVIVARDDRGLVRIERVVTVERSGGHVEEDRRDVLWRGAPVDRREITGELNLADLGVTAGDRIALRAEAFDARVPEVGGASATHESAGVPSGDGAGNSSDNAARVASAESFVGRSLVRTLIVVTDDEKKREIDAARAALEGELDRIADGQRSARDRTTELLVQQRTTGRLRERDVDVLKGVELDQRRTAEQLADPTEGVLPRAERLLRDLEDNDVRDPEVRGNLGTLIDELRFLDERELSGIASNLTAARKRADAESAADDSTKPDAPAGGEEPLAAARDGQTRVVDTLDELLARLSKSRTRRELEGDLDDLVAEQRTLRDRSGQLAGHTLGKSFADLPEQDRAELGKIAGRQRTRAEEVDRLRRRLETTAEALSESSPDSADLLRDAADLLNDRATAAGMESAAEGLERNDVGRGVEAQERALADLRDVRSALDDRAVTDTETLVRQLREAEEELAGLRGEQAELLRRTRDANVRPDDDEHESRLAELRREQRDLRELVSRSARRLGRLQSRRAASAARRAAERMDDVERLLKDDSADRGEEAQQEALDDLEQAERDVAADRRAAEERLAREMLESVGDELASMIERENAIVAETERLQREIAERGTPSRGHNATLRNLADVQRTLGRQADDLARRLEAADVFVLALNGASAEMTRAAERLAERRADERTLAIERAAVRRIEALIAALAPEPHNGDEPLPKEGGGGTSDEPRNEGGEPSLVSAIAQLRLLKSLQEELLARTQRLDATRRDDGMPADEIDTELESIATEQERIADLVRAMVDALTGGPSREEPGIGPVDSTTNPAPPTGDSIGPAETSKRDSHDED